MPMSIRTKIASLAEQITAKLERQYREDAELLVAGVIVSARNPEGPVSTHYLFAPTSPKEAIELLDETRRALIEEAY
jgi:hypothetical protein